MEPTTGQMADSTRATGMTESSMVRVNSPIAKGNANSGNGIMESELGGLTKG